MRVVHSSFGVAGHGFSPRALPIGCRHGGRLADARWNPEHRVCTELKFGKSGPDGASAVHTPRRLVCSHFRYHPRCDGRKEVRECEYHSAETRRGLSVRKCTKACADTSARHLAEVTTLVSALSEMLPHSEGATAAPAYGPTRARWRTQRLATFISIIPVS